jgi:type IV fimbrial biogenesis protein FimT
MKYSGRGFSLIELLIAVAIMGILLALAAPAYRTWMGNMRIRTTAESIQNGLQLARAEGVRRNAQIRFQFTDSTAGACALSTTVSNWVVSYDNPAGACTAALLNEAYPVNDAAHNPPPRILQVRTAAEGSRNVIVAADQSSFVFNGLGRVTPLPATNPVAINVTPDAAVGDCATLRCLRVTVTAGGQIRMCDPTLTLTKPNDPQSC